MILLCVSCVSARRLLRSTSTEGRSTVVSIWVVGVPRVGIKNRAADYREQQRSQSYEQVVSTFLSLIGCSPVGPVFLPGRRTLRVGRHSKNYATLYVDTHGTARYGLTNPLYRGVAPEREAARWMRFALQRRDSARSCGSYLL